MKQFAYKGQGGEESRLGVFMLKGKKKEICLEPTTQDSWGRGEESRSSLWHYNPDVPALREVGCLQHSFTPAILGKNLHAQGTHTTCSWPLGLTNACYTVLSSVTEVKKNQWEVNTVYQLRECKWGTTDQQIYQKRNFLVVFFVSFLHEKLKMSFKAQDSTSSLEGP